MWRKARSIATNFAGVAVFIVIWEVVALAKNDPLFLVGPWKVAVGFGSFVQTTGYWNDWRVSMTEYVLGMMLAVVTGIVLGVLLGLIPTLRKAFDPLLAVGTATPSIALAPLFIIWFGIGLTAKVMIIFFVAVWAVIVGTLTGIANVDPLYHDITKAFGTRNFRKVRTVLLPAALPALVAGLRVSAGVGLIGVIVGEFFGSSAGLGYLIFDASNTFDVTQLFVGLLSLAFVGVAITLLLRAVERRVSW